MNWYVNAIKNYALFDGRSTRMEYWLFVLFNVLFAILAYSFDLIFGLKIGDTGLGPIYLVYALFSFIPGLAIAIRRLHDIDKNGWTLLLAFIPIIGGIWLILLFCKEGDDDQNAFGPKREEELEFIHSNSKNNQLLIIAFAWILFSKLLWTLFPIVFGDYYKNEYFTKFNEIMLLFSGLFPLLLASAMKNHKWKIICLLIALLYFILNFYELLKFHLLQQQNFNF
jgi:uncharacterized membrane protein YhaH (DUF805 family)